jgi:sigma-E factor negative regulatory protein RseA
MVDNKDTRPEDRRESLSALADGQADEQALASLCAAWQHDAEARRSWHTYHLIGDVLRSSDMAGSPARDHDLLQRVRSRLAAEPVVLAPQRADMSRRLRALAAPVAVAAGFAAVAGVTWLTRIGLPDDKTATLAIGPTQAGALRPVATQSTAMGHRQWPVDS